WLAVSVSAAASCHNTPTGPRDSGHSSSFIRDRPNTQPGGRTEAPCRRGKTMTEGDWLVCENSRRMLEYVPYNVSKRKWRLMAVAFCRNIWHLFTDDRCKQVVETAERWADGLTTLKELNKAEK